MNIQTEKLGKKFGKEWIFQNFTFSFANNQAHAIVGNNGSGKSTLLKTLLGLMPASVGTVAYFAQPSQVISAELWFRQVALATPYMELIEELTLREAVDFHFKFKTMQVTEDELIDQLGWGKRQTQQAIRFFSSGMKQKLKLAFAIFAKTPILCLDEPCANLDQTNIDWYTQKIQEQVGKRTILICSNQAFEYQFCKHLINMQHWK